MFCRNCGKELPDNAEYCPECGFRITSKTIGTADKPEETDISKKNHKVKKEVPLKGNTMEYEIGGNSFRKEKGNYFKYVGVVAGILAFISLFMDWTKLSSNGLSYLGKALIGEDGSYSFLDLVNESGMGLLSVLTMLFIALVIILQLLNHPRLSVVGCLWMVIVAVLFIETMDRSSLFYKYSFGSILYILATITACVAAFAPKKRKQIK